MANARQTHITVSIEVDDAIFKATGKRIDFPGFFRAYVEGSDDPNAALEDREVTLPALKVGDTPSCTELEPIGHETKPPARYTEATLVKTLEREGIGRPSTYASVIGTIIDRGYVHPLNNSLMPTFTAFAVTELLDKHFPDLVDVKFTARMERTLDDISTGEADWLPYLKKFYSGDTGLSGQVEARESQIDPAEARTVDLSDLSAKVRIGKYGPYIEAISEAEGEDSVRASIPLDVSPADLNDEQVQVLLKQKTEGPEKLGLHPETGEPIYALIGPYGPYVRLGDKTEEKPKPKQVSLPKGVTRESVDLEMAVGLLSLPRLLGLHPETEAKIKASLGRFGPYVVHDQGKDGKDYRSLKGDDDVLQITLERALELLAQPKRGRGRKAAKPLRELGNYPDTEEPINIYDGPYGPYIKYEKVNASLPEGKKVEDITLEEALEIIAAKAATKKKTTRRKTTTKKSTTKKSTAKKSTTKKATTKKASTTKASTTKKSSTTAAAKKSTAAKGKSTTQRAKKTTASDAE